MSDRWPVEEIPDDDTLYMRVHRQWMNDGSVLPGCFQNRPDEATGAMSSDWAKYATTEETRQRARRPEMNAVIALNAGQVRAIPEQHVVHSPVQHDPVLPDNRAHTDIAGPKEADPEIRRLFVRIASLVIALPEP
jgi:hypothetical protein